MWNSSTSIHEPEVARIKDALIAEGIVDESVFIVNKNFDISSGATHYPIIFLLDVSGSLRPERENLNAAIQNFIKDILSSRTTLSESIDFSIVTFADKVKIKRPFGYITENDLLSNSNICSIGENDLGGLTKMASGMFVAWYIAEVRKCMYKDVKNLDYKQPVFILISDLCNNERTMIDGEPLIKKIISFYNAKYENNKLGLLKALFGKVEKSYNDQIKGVIIDAPIGLSEMLGETFKLLLSTIADQDKHRYLVPDEEDDDVFIYSDISTEKKQPVFSSEMARALDELYKDDTD